MLIRKKHTRKLFRIIVNYWSSFLNNLVLSRGKLLVAPLFYLYSNYTNNSVHKALSCANPQKIVFGVTYVNTTKNCIHFLCKNNWSNFAPVGFACIISPQG